MKKTLLSAAIASMRDAGIFLAKSTTPQNDGLSDINLANAEALAKEEGPVVLNPPCDNVSGYKKWSLEPTTGISRKENFSDCCYFEKKGYNPVSCTASKMKLQFGVVSSVCILLLSGCKFKDNSSGMEMSRTSYDLANIKTTTVECQKDSLPVLIAIEEMYNYDNDLLVSTDADTFAFYQFDAQDLVLKDRFGKHGQGPDEIVNPQICLTKAPRPLYVIDSWKHRMQSISDINDTLFIGNELMNMAREISFPYIGYYRLNGIGREVCILDVNSGDLTDSLNITEKFPELKDSQFVWDTHSDKAVIAFCTVDALIVLDVSSGKIDHCLLGRGDKPDGTVMFGQVQCLENCFVVMNLSEYETVGSQIIFFNYGCTPIAAINTGVAARRMMYDSKNHRVLMLGLSDDYIYSFEIPDSIKIG